MAVPGDEKAVGTISRGQLRASHADREYVVDRLKAAFTQGRLTKDEFDLRIGQALAARSCGELATVTADIPMLIGSRPPRQPAARARRPGPAAGEQGSRVRRVRAHCASHFRRGHLPR